MKDLDSFSSKLQRTLEKLGKENGLAPRPSQDPADADMHEYYVAQTGEALFKKRKEAALARLTGHDPVAANVLAVVAATKKKDAKETATLVNGQHYTLTIETRKPTHTVKTDKIAAHLTKIGWTAEQIAKMFKECEVVQEPAKSFRANPIRE